MQECVDHLTKNDLVKKTDKRQTISWEAASPRTAAKAKKQVLANQHQAVSEHTHGIGAEEETLKVAIEYAPWSAVAELRNIARKAS